MNSSTSRNNTKKLTQDEIKRQIAELQSRLDPESVQEDVPLECKSPKRKAPEPVTLAPATPSPKKKRRVEHHAFNKPLPRPIFQTAPQQNSSHIAAAISKPPEQKLVKTVAPSNLINKLASMERPNDLDDTAAPLVRSTGFSETPAEIQPQPEERLGHKRDERLVLIENLEPGPYEHVAPHDDADFERLEPHSGINLKSRSIPHEEFKDYFIGRYYLSPSRLYSAVRLLPDKQGYDVPVPGDWITIAVVAERGPIKFTRPPMKMEREEGDQKDSRKPWKGKAKAEPERPGKKFVNLKLIDFGARSGSSSSAKAVIRGDAFLNLLLFEADSVELIPREDGQKPDKVYRGGSKGAFERLTEVREGDVIALLNPNILKPFQRSANTPHPVENVLAVTPESANTIAVVGRCRDLGMCKVEKRDGNACGSWCDKRVSDVCDYHVQSAVQRRRAARPEFSVGTGGMSNTSTHKRKHDYDPRRQWGLKPEERTAGGNATYMVSGHIVSGTSADSRTLYAAESIGREGQAKAARRLAGKDSDQALKKLLERDKEGMQAVMKAREFGHGGEAAKGGKKGSRKETMTQKLGDVGGAPKDVPKTAYSASIIKSLGFDPAMKTGQQRTGNEGLKNKLEALEAIRKARKDPDLGPKPGPRIRSGVKAPIQKSDRACVEPAREGIELMHDLGDSGDEFPEVLVANNALEVESPDKEENMVDLDDF